MLHIIIPTRENKGALASLLGAFLSQGLDERPCVLHISDSSNIPVLQDRHVCRLLSGLRFQYEHTHHPEVNEQRLSILNQLQGGAPVLSIDDDLLPREGYVESLFEVAQKVESGEIQVVFGITVDLMNERGYPDYKTKDARLPLSTHRFCGKAFPSVHDCQEAEQFSATVGHMLTTASAFRSALSLARKKMGVSYRSEIADDAAATYLARLHGGRVAPRMECWHLGNDNNWWEPWKAKRSTVDSLVVAMDTPDDPSTEKALIHA